MIALAQSTGQSLRDAEALQAQVRALQAKYRGVGIATERLPTRQARQAPTPAQQAQRRYGSGNAALERSLPPGDREGED
ncbi:MAG: hypothetical protein KGL39_06815 [Patescibacteria group bacterium]|nr:hypothetical protein [Patescibacteria group bacterium]